MFGKVDVSHSPAVCSKLSQVLSPERGLSILCQLLHTHPNLWESVHEILKDGSDLGPLPQAEVELCPQHQQSVGRVFALLNPLQLAELPEDLIGLIVNYMTFKENVCWSHTSTFFHSSVLKAIEHVRLINTYDWLNTFFTMCERLRFLSIESSTSFQFPYQCLRTLRQIQLSDIVFTHQLPKSQENQGKSEHPCGLSIVTTTTLEEDILARIRTYLSPTNALLKCSADEDPKSLFPLTTLSLSACRGLLVKPWLAITQKESAPELKEIRISSHISQELDDIDIHDTDFTLESFTQSLLASDKHTQIEKLSLHTTQLPIFTSLTRNGGCRLSLEKLEIGFLDRRFREEVSSSTSIQPLFMSLALGEVFPNLKMLILDFAPQPWTTGETIFPSDIATFMHNVPEKFPQLKLLAFYGSRYPLLFGDEHFRALLQTPVPSLCDISLGFEIINYSVIQELIDSDCFPNLVWLTLELMGAQDNLKHIEDIVEGIEEHKLKYLEWITICICQSESIKDLSNGISIECWNRGVDECDFDEALLRSINIANSKQQIPY